MPDFVNSRNSDYSFIEERAAANLGEELASELKSTSQVEFSQSRFEEKILDFQS